jgi:hypothetical protein
MFFAHRTLRGTAEGGGWRRGVGTDQKGHEVMKKWEKENDAVAVIGEYEDVKEELPELEAYVIMYASSVEKGSTTNKIPYLDSAYHPTRNSGDEAAAIIDHVVARKKTG